MKIYYKRGGIFETENAFVVEEHDAERTPSIKAYVNGSFITLISYKNKKFAEEVMKNITNAFIFNQDFFELPDESPVNVKKQNIESYNQKHDETIGLSMLRKENTIELLYNLPNENCHAKILLSSNDKSDTNIEELKQAIDQLKLWATSVQKNEASISAITKTFNIRQI